MIFRARTLDSNVQFSQKSHKAFVLHSNVQFSAKNYKAFKETGMYGPFKGNKKSIETVPDRTQGRSTRQRL